MNRRQVFWLAFGSLALILLLWIWFTQNFERRPYERYEGAQKEAYQNRFLALERFLALSGRSSKLIKDPARIDEVTGRGVLVLDAARRRTIPPERAARLLQWVAQGGYLIVAAERGQTSDPLLQHMGITHPLPEKPRDDAADRVQEKPPETFVVRLPGAAKGIHVRTGYLSESLLPGALQPAWRAGPNDRQALILHYPWGGGQITVFQDLSIFNNWSIGQHDHAELVEALMTRYQPSGTVWLALRLKSPGLGEWLLEHAPLAMAAFAIWLAFWLWRIVPRFGGLRRLPPPERRGLREHLAAMGRGVWKAGGLPHWLAVERRSTLAHISLRHPQLLRESPEQRAYSLQKLTGVEAARIHQALDAPYLTHPRDFTQAVRTLQTLVQKI